jgi:hypothetical protein
LFWDWCPKFAEIESTAAKRDPLLPQQRKRYICELVFSDTQLVLRPGFEFLA